MTNDDDSALITSRLQFQDALRVAFVEAATKGAHELWLCDEDFATWPLGEPALIDSLTAWASGRRRMTLIARHFDEFARRHPRWVDWRRTYSHLVTCRKNVEVASGEFPVVLVASGVVTVRLSDVTRFRGRHSFEKSDELLGREQIDAVLQRSEDAFPATTTGL